MLTLLNYLFDLYPPQFAMFGWVVFAFFALLFLFYIVLSVHLKKNHKKYDGLERKFLRKLKGWAFWAGLAGLLLWFLRFETIPWLSMRFILWLWIVVVTAWFVYVLHYKFVVMPRRRREIAIKTGKTQ